LPEIDRDLLAEMREHATAYASCTPVRRVAVVANAPLPPSKERRDTIASSDLVIRCNSFALDGPDAPPCVGTRTNVVVAARTTRPSPAFFRDYRRRAYFVGDAFHLTVPEPPGWPTHWPTDLGAWMVPNRAIALPLKYLLQPERAGLDVLPTTGTSAAYIACRLFPEAEIVLTGYSFLDDPDQESWGYQLKGLPPSRVPSWHVLHREATFLRRLVDRGEVRFLA